MDIQIADRDRFHCRHGFDWQMRRPVTYFWTMLESSFRNDGIKGVRREVVGFLKTKCEDSGVYIEFVNCLTHLAESVLNGRVAHLVEKGYSESDARKNASEWPLYRSLLRCHEVMHQMWDLRVRQKDKKAWHIRLSKLEKSWSE